MRWGEPLRDRARGRWPGILAALGVPEEALRNRHGPCPMCGGKDRFRFDDKEGRGTWICSHCGNGDGIDFVKRLLNAEFGEAARRIEQHIGAAPIIAHQRPRQTDEAKRQKMKARWDRAAPVTLDNVAGRYLHARTGLTTFSRCLRFSPDEEYFYEGEPGRSPTRHPVMLAKVDPSDAAAAKGERPILHQTYLDPHGGKAVVPHPRKFMTGLPAGAAVRLMDHGDVLGIAEGIETAFSAAILFDVPVWSALDAGQLAKWSPPANVTKVFVFGDNDPSFTGQAAAYALARRLTCHELEVVVEIPPVVGTDWNDVLLEILREKEMA